MVSAGPSLTDVVRSVLPRDRITGLLAPLARPCAVSPRGRASTALTPSAIQRVVSVFGSDTGTGMLRAKLLGGGCTVASPFGNNVADGTNCKALPNVKDAGCDHGSCVVRSCKDGFNVSKTGDSCVKAPANRARNTADMAIIDDCFNRLISHDLLVPGFNIVVGRNDILATVLVLTYNNVLQSLIDQCAVAGVPNLLELADILGIDFSLLRRDNTYNIDNVLRPLFDKGLIVGYYDFPTLKAFLGAAVLALDVDDLLAFLVGQNLVLITDILQLKELLGLGVAVL